MGSARGVLVTAAKRIGCPPADYAARIVAGEKWCIGCKTRYHVRADRLEDVLVIATALKRRIATHELN